MPLGSQTNYIKKIDFVKCFFYSFKMALNKSDFIRRERQLLHIKIIEIFLLV